MNDYYTPVDPDFEDKVMQTIQNLKNGKIHFFNANGAVEDAKGKILKMEKRGTGIFIVMDNAVSIRLDQIITLFGFPGPAYEAYSNLAEDCHSCFNAKD